MCTVVNKYKESFDVYIGRGSKWGNPFPITKENKREYVIDLYKVHLDNLIKTGKITIEDLRELKGKKLGCFCKPKPCHGDVIQQKVKWAMTQKVDPIEF